MKALKRVLVLALMFFMIFGIKTLAANTSTDQLVNELVLAGDESYPDIRGFTATDEAVTSKDKNIGISDFSKVESIEYDANSNVILSYPKAIKAGQPILIRLETNSPYEGPNKAGFEIKSGKAKVEALTKLMKAVVENRKVTYTQTAFTPQNKMEVATSDTTETCIYSSIYILVTPQQEGTIQIYTYAVEGGNKVEKTFKIQVGKPEARVVYKTEKVAKVSVDDGFAVKVDNAKLWTVAAAPAATPKATPKPTLKATTKPTSKPSPVSVSTSNPDLAAPATVEASTENKSDAMKVGEEVGSYVPLLIACSPFIVIYLIIRIVRRIRKSKNKLQK